MLDLKFLGSSHQISISVLNLNQLDTRSEGIDMHRYLWSGSFNWLDLMIGDSQCKLLYFVSLLNLMIFQIKYICDMFNVFSAISADYFVKQIVLNDFQLDD